MGLHPSLKRGGDLISARSVMKRAERIKWLQEKGRWQDGQRVLGLPKIKVIKLKTAKKVKEEKSEQTPEAEKK